MNALCTAALLSSAFFVLQSTGHRNTYRVLLSSAFFVLATGTHRVAPASGVPTIGCPSATTQLQLLAAPAPTRLTEQNLAVHPGIFDEKIDEGRDILNLGEAVPERLRLVVGYRVVGFLRVEEGRVCLSAEGRENEMR